jgi:hypothetical protein
MRKIKRDTAGDALWEVKLTTHNAGGVVVGTDTHKIQLDNTLPQAFVDIYIGRTNCSKFKIGDPLGGSYVAMDDYMNRFYLSITPPVNPGLDIPVPSTGLTYSLPYPNSIWSLDTKAMIPCGYVINPTVIDRAFVNNGHGSYRSYAYAGFCLEQKK